MRKQQKEQIINSVQTIEKAHELLAGMIEGCRVQDAMLLLQQCQESAIIIGTVIEDSEGQGFVTVAMLEEYCEAIYQIHVSLTKKEFISGAEVRKTLSGILERVRNSISEDIKEKKEVLFLPYKASMWDSLESIWLAADADPSCDAYVMPIPYFDKNPDGTVREMHYEGELFPEYVPITHYDSYRPEERHPDAIFIHNPYDEANYVTTIHPAFYSKTIKEYTDCLVYVPYFVLNEINPQDKVSVKYIEHFIMVPGVLHADRVVVQSEAMRQIYVNVMTQWAGEKTRKYWEKKILGTGSPKVDKVHNIKKENIRLPEEWLELIERPGEKRKKVVFYNTSVSAFLQHGEDMIEKMKSVFAFFAENSEEVVLLWRPHPLMKATIESMKPDLWEKYSKLVEEYKACRFGIYDDSPELDRAIAVCDGYYGDGSSVVKLCEEAGKPMLLQSFRCAEGNAVIFEDFCEKDGKLIFVARDINMICELDTESGKTKILGNIPDEKIMEDRLASKIDLWKNFLVFTPLAAKKILIFNCDTKQWKEIHVQDKNVQLKFFQTLFYEEKLYLIGTCYPSILKVDLENGNVTYYDEIFENIPDSEAKNQNAFFRNDYARCGQILYLASCMGNHVLKFDLKTGEFEWIEIGKAKNCYSGMTWDGRYFWLSPRDNTSIVRWDGKKEVLEMDLPKGATAPGGLFLGVVDEGKEIVFPGTYQSKTVTLSKDSERDIQVLDEQYTCYRILENKRRICQMTNGKVLIRDESGVERIYDNQPEEKELELYLNQYEKNIRSELRGHRGIESNLFDLRRFCKVLDPGVSEEEKRGEINVGKTVWESIKGVTE